MQKNRLLVSDFLKKTEEIYDNKSEVFDDLSFEALAPVAEDLMDRFEEGQYDRIELVYNRFKNAATQIVTREQFLPLVTSENEDQASADYIFEPDKEEIVKGLIPKSLKVQLYKATRDSFASEHGARMTAMDKATENANELLKELRLTYNRTRQAAITKEILEIVGGAEALAQA